MPLTELSLVRTQSFRIVGAALIAGVAALLLDSGLTARVAPTLTSIAVAPVNPSIGAGQTQAFAATGTFSDSSTRALDGDGAWVAKAGIPGDRMAAAAAVVNGKVYVIGGSTDELNILDTVQEYDPV
ncbi:MAG: hypothetical protein HYX76_01120, partial [Acidobacteria bacterium]|nr:hypothetical protein [Acidobacteriota bacterium]